MRVPSARIGSAAAFLTRCDTVVERGEPAEVDLRQNLRRSCAQLRANRPSSKEGKA